MNKSLKVFYKGKEYFVNAEEANDPELEKIFLYLDKDLNREYKDFVGIPKLASKRDLNFLIDEAAGAGFAVWGGMNRGGYGNPSSGGAIYGRGSGFGQSSSNNGGPNLMYTYDVKPLNKTLEQPPTPQAGERYFHVGSEIRGEMLDTSRKKILGKIIRIEKNREGDILYYIVIDDSGIKRKVDPTSVSLIQRESPSIVNRDIVGEMEFPSLSDFLSEYNFIKTGNIKDGLKIGLKEEIRNFFGELGVSEEEYKFEYRDGILYTVLPKERFLDLSRRNIQYFIDNVEIGLGLSLTHCGLREVPENLKTKNLWLLHNPSLKKLPESLMVTKNLDLRGTGIKEIPLKVWDRIENSLSLFDNQLELINFARAHKKEGLVWISDSKSGEILYNF